MTVTEAIAGRRSIRSYDGKPVEEEKLLKVLEAGRLAPSSRNRQEWKFILVREREKLDALFEACDRQPHVGQAPAMLVVVATNELIMACGQNAGPIDASIALTCMMLQAHELGLGTCWLGRFYADKVKAALDIPAECHVVAVTPIGYPSGAEEAKPRRSFDEVVCFDTYK